MKNHWPRNDSNAELPNQEYVAVYYDEEDAITQWYLGRLIDIQASDNCPECKSFPLPECNDGYHNCFRIRFMKLGQMKRKVPKSRQQSLGPDRSLWQCEPSDKSLYHVTVCQIVPCKVIVNQTSNNVFTVQNVSEIDDFLKCNVLYMLKNS